MKTTHLWWKLSLALSRLSLSHNLRQRTELVLALIFIGKLSSNLIAIRNIFTVMERRQMHKCGMLSRIARDSEFLPFMYSFQATEFSLGSKIELFPFVLCPFELISIHTHTDSGTGSGCSPPVRHIQDTCRKLVVRIYVTVR